MEGERLALHCHALRLAGSPGVLLRRGPGQACHQACCRHAEWIVGRGRENCGLWVSEVIAGMPDAGEALPHGCGLQQGELLQGLNEGSNASRRPLAVGNPPIPTGWLKKARPA